MLRDSKFVHDLLDWSSFGYAATLMTLPETKGESILSLARDFFSGENVRFNIRYGGEPRECLDVYFVPSGSDAPVVLFVHGGAWGTGDKRLYRLLGRQFQRRGIVCVVMGYPTWPEADANAQSISVRKAIDWTERHATKFGAARVPHISVIGHSSGAHISALSLLDTSCTPRVEAFIGMSGVYDIESHYQFERTRGVEEISPLAPANFRRDDYVSATASEERLFPTEMSPLALLRQYMHTLSAKRVLLVHGISDDVVPLESSEKLYDALLETQMGRPTFLLPDKRADHITPVTDLMLGSGIFKTVLNFSRGKGTASKL